MIVALPASSAVWVYLDFVTTQKTDIDIFTTVRTSTCFAWSELSRVDIFLEQAVACNWCPKRVVDC
jgi:hypothetical protein